MARRKTTNPFGIGPSTLLEQALARHREGRFAEATGLYEALLKSDPKHFDSLHMLGLIALQTGNPERGRQLIGAAIAIKPDVAAAHANLAAVHRALGRLDDALLSYNRAIRLQSDRVASHHDRGDVLLALGRPAEAVASFDEVLALDPGHIDAGLGRGIALERLDRADASELRGAEAVDALRRDYATAFYNLGNSLLGLKRPGEALASYDRALALAPDFAEAHNNRATILFDLRRPAEAVTGYDRALALRPDWPEPHNNRANALWALGYGEAALGGYDRAITLRPDYPEAFHNRGNVLLSLRRPAEALIGFETAQTLGLGMDFLPGAILNAQLKAADWAGLDGRVEALHADILAGKRAVLPFIAAALFDDADIQSRAARIFSESLHPGEPRPVASAVGGTDRKIRVGYYSFDFREHAVSHLIAGLFESYDSDRFECFAFSFGPESPAPIRRRLEASRVRFVDVRYRDDEGIAALSREMGIDIAIDLNGHTEGARHGIFAARCAPIQVNYLGYPGTMGSGHHDYVIADRIILPREHWHHYGERVAYLPDCYQVTDSKRAISQRAFTRADFGLPEQAFVFACFNTISKILPAVFDRWMRILGAVEGSVLWLYEDNLAAVANLRREAQARGIDPERLIFAPHSPQDEHLARHRLADLFIDTWPYNAHTTASDALWAGLPLLTYKGKSFPARVAASLLTAAGLSDLITEDEDDYERRAIELATDPAQLAAIRAKLDANRLACPLFDTARFARNIEAIYAAMVARHRAGMWPAPLVLPGV